MDISRRNFFKGVVASTLYLSATSMLKAENDLLASNQNNIKRIVLICLDGISVAGYQKAKTPNLDNLLKDGVLSLRTRVVMPSVTLPNWTSHLTGSGPEQHGVTDNRWDFSQIKLPAVETDEDGYYPSVFNILKKNIPDVKIGFYYNWANLIKPYNKRWFDEISYLSEDIKYIENIKKAYAFMSAHKENLSLVFLYTVHTDSAGHKYKWMSPEYIKSIEDADEQVGWLIEKMKGDGTYNDTCFLFLTDHGGIENGHGGVSVDEMIVPWGIVGPGIKSGSYMAEPNNTINTAAIILQLWGIKVPSCWIGKVPFSIFQ